MRYEISLSRHSMSSRIYKHVLKISLEIFVKLNSMIIMAKIVILAFTCYIWRVNRMKVYFHGAKLSYLSFFRNTHGICRMTPGLTDKSYINFQDVTSTLKNMRTTLFARQGMSYFGSSLTIVGVRWMNRTFTVTQLDQQSIGVSSDEYESLLEPEHILNEEN